MERAKQKESLGPEWQDPAIFEMYESGRGLFRDVAKDLVSDVFQSNVSENGPIVELGSGIGELERLIPEKFRKRLVGLERAEIFSHTHKEHNKDAKLVVGDIEQLPVRDDSTENVVSFAVFDTLRDLDKAMLEVKRMLKNKGRFTHIIDLQPNAHIIMDNLPESVIPFPNMEGGAIQGFRMVKLEDYEKIKNTIDPLRRPIFDLYVDNPMYTYAYLEQNNQRISYDIAKTVKDWGLNAGTIAYAQAFGDSMESAIRNNGLKIINNKVVTKEKIIERNEAHNKFPQYNCFENDVGSIFKRYESGIPEGKVRVISKMHVFVAEKE